MSDEYTIGTIYVRHQLPPVEKVRAFGPRLADDGDRLRSTLPCMACRLPFKPGDWTTLVALGPGDDDEAQEKARAGRWFNAVALEVHLACATGHAEPLG